MGFQEERRAVIPNEIKYILDMFSTKQNPQCFKERIELSQPLDL